MKQSTRGGIICSVTYPLGEHSVKEKGYTLVSPQIGELVTSLDMTGIALSVTFLDDELEKLWLAPADTPAFKLGNASAARGERRVVKELYEDVCYEEGSPASRAAASFIVLALERMQKAIEKNEEELARIDAVAGDGDHGRGMPDVQDNYLAVCQVRW